MLNRLSRSCCEGEPERALPRCVRLVTVKLEVGFQIYSGWTEKFVGGRRPGERPPVRCWRSRRRVRLANPTRASFSIRKPEHWHGPVIMSRPGPRICGGGRIRKFSAPASQDLTELRISLAAFFTCLAQMQATRMVWSDQCYGTALVRWI